MQQLTIEEQKIAERAELETSVRSVTIITTQEQADTIAGKLDAIIAWRKGWAAYWEDSKTKAYAAWKSICNKVSEMDTPAEADEKHCRVLLGKWIVEQRRKAELERQKLIEAEKQRQSEEAEAAAMEAESQGATVEEVQAIFDQAESAPMVAVAPVPPRQSFVSSAFTPRDNWMAEVDGTEIEAKKKLCAAIAAGQQSPMLIDINWTVLNQMARAQKQTMNINGFRAVNRPGVAKKAGR